MGRSASYRRALGIQYPCTASGRQPLTQTKPTITGTTHELPFGSLSPRDFERLCLWLVEREGWTRAEHLGTCAAHIAGRTHASYLLPWPNPSPCESFVLINTHCPEVSGV